MSAISVILGKLVLTFIPVHITKIISTLSFFIFGGLMIWEYFEEDESQKKEIAEKELAIN